MNVDDLRRLPRRWPGVTFDQWLQGLNDLQLVEYAAGRLVDIRRLHDELGACRDCFHEAVWLLRERRAPYVAGEVLGRWLELWLADAREQADHEAQQQLNAKARRLLDERRRDDEGAA